MFKTFDTPLIIDRKTTKFKCVVCNKGWRVKIKRGTTRVDGEISGYRIPANWPLECPKCGSEYFKCLKNV